MEYKYFWQTSVRLFTAHFTPACWLLKSSTTRPLLKGSKMISPTAYHALLMWYWVTFCLTFFGLGATQRASLPCFYLSSPGEQGQCFSGQRKHLSCVFTSLPGTLRRCITKRGHLQLHCLKQQLRRNIHLNSTAFQVTDSALWSLELFPTDGAFRDQWFAGGLLCFFHLIQTPVTWRQSLPLKTLKLPMLRLKPY